MTATSRSRGRLLAMAVAALLVAALAVPALAQDATDDTGSTDALEAQGEDWRDARREAFATRLATELAEELDIPVDEVEAALANVHDRMRAERQERRQEHLAERLDEAVAAGELTQEQADAIADAAEAGVFGRSAREGLRGFGHHGPRFGGPGIDGAGYEMPDDVAADRA